MNNLSILSDSLYISGYEYVLTKETKAEEGDAPYKITLSPIKEGFEVSTPVWNLENDTLVAACKELRKELIMKKRDHTLENGPIVLTQSSGRRY